MSWMSGNFGISSLLIILSAVSPCSIFMLRSDCDEMLWALVFERLLWESSVLLLSPDFLKEWGRDVFSMWPPEVGEFSSIKLILVKLIFVWKGDWFMGSFSWRSPLFVLGEFYFDFSYSYLKDKGIVPGPLCYGLIELIIMPSCRTLCISS